MKTDGPYATRSSSSQGERNQSNIRGARKVKKIIDLPGGQINDPSLGNTFYRLTPVSKPVNKRLVILVGLVDWTKNP